MSHGSKPITPRDLDWIQRQLKHPNPMYLVSELALLAGRNMSTRRLRRWLVRKGVIEERDGQGRNHLVPLSRLKALWPEWWISMKSAWAEAGLGRRREEDEAA